MKKNLWLRLSLFSLAGLLTIALVKFVVLGVSAAPSMSPTMQMQGTNQGAQMQGMNQGMQPPAMGPGMGQQMMGSGMGMGMTGQGMR